MAYPSSFLALFTLPRNFIPLFFLAKNAKKIMVYFFLPRMLFLCVLCASARK